MSGEPPVKAQCLPFSQIPHTTRLFTDFLAWAPNVRGFYSRSPHFPEWIADPAAVPKLDASRREQVAAILERQNSALGASPRTLLNIARLKAGASALVTGQQVGLLGGPLFSLFKALTAVKLADEATKAGVDCVPIFWLATQDHDLAEVNQVAIPGQDGSLQTLHASVHATEDAPVGTVTFGEEINEVVEAAAGLLGTADAVAALRDSYRPGETFGGAFARLFVKLFSGWGVILLDASDPQLNALAEPIYRAALEGAANLETRLQARSKELETAGYHQQVKVTDSSTLLFMVRNGRRLPIHRQGSGRAETFVVGDETISREDLMRHLSASPGDFSANVLLRPVVQDYLLPTVAYTGGAAEVAYFAQAAVVYESLLGKVTPIIPRFSATILDSKAQTILERFGISFLDVMRGPEHLRENLAASTLPKELKSAFENAGSAVEKSMAAIREYLERLDKTLVDSAANAESKMRHQLETLHARAARAELRQDEIVSRKAEWLSNTLFPNKALQEREVAAVYFLARHGAGLLDELYSAIHTDCLDHQVISL